MLWSRTDLRPADVDIAQLYDGFSFHTINWLENFGFCERYGAKDFIEGGHRIALDGDLPVNTGGGALSAGGPHRSDRRRVGEAGGSHCRIRVCAYHKKKK